MNHRQKTIGILRHCFVGLIILFVGVLILPTPVQASSHIHPASTLHLSQLGTDLEPFVWNGHSRLSAFPAPDRGTRVTTTWVSTPTATVTPTITATVTPTVTATATPTVTSTATPTGCGSVLGEHTVQPGETLYAIGRAYSVQPSAIATCNSIINPSLIHTGIKLKIPNAKWSSIPPGPVAVKQFEQSPTVSPCRAYHTVQWGSNLFRISLIYNVNMWTLAETNNILNLNYILAGQVLCIP